ncbi:MAG: RNA ligase family protein [Myxococcales bacterium]|nr:RNA ligase family protein [Myxococcales bacterium]
MTERLRYPRLPHLVDAKPGDLALTKKARETFLAEPLVVEEKLDGANVSVRFDPRAGPTVAGRSGSGSDRGGQLGRLRAWAAERHTKLAGLPSGSVLYGEWLYLAHSIFYDRLPDYFVLLDLKLADGTFVDRRRREELAQAHDLALAPLLFEGRVKGLAHLDSLVGQSAFGSMRAEGAVLRQESAGHVHAWAKWVRPDFEQKSDEDWEQDRRVNRLLPR